MRHEPHKTVIGAARDALHALMNLRGWKFASLAQHVVEVHVSATGDVHTFQAGGDPLRAMKTNSERLARWLDDVTKDSTLLPANLLPSVLLALPPDLRVSCAQALLDGTGLAVSLVGDGDSAAGRAAVLATGIKEGSEAISALAGYLATPQPSADQARAALAEISEASAAHADAQRLLHADLVRMGVGHD